jgi:hypothetical protein
MKHLIFLQETTLRRRKPRSAASGLRSAQRNQRKTLLSRPSWLPTRPTGGAFPQQAHAGSQSEVHSEPKLWRAGSRHRADPGRSAPLAPGNPLALVLPPLRSALRSLGVDWRRKSVGSWVTTAVLMRAPLRTRTSLGNGRGPPGPQGTAPHRKTQARPRPSRTECGRPQTPLGLRYRRRQEHPPARVAPPSQPTRPARRAARRTARHCQDSRFPELRQPGRQARPSTWPYRALRATSAYFVQLRGGPRRPKPRARSHRCRAPRHAYRGYPHTLVRKQVGRNNTTTGPD